ncbi:MAG TPA: DUF3084 domain-containing protein [Synergistaceae bacterium]|nr:DUF3084 domain-containing protein [Synergistaceae bacterium]HPJ25179.1 DUF3084 domain-containing protein [Synergistaceae bacterium]HPQ36749.1 DUF3084 domain-containing protein [Synergistaceae bacterium]
MALLFEANWGFIISLLFLSGGIAFLGDLIGRKIGRRRVSLFGLRPRHTSSLITVLTALSITLGTLTALAIMSDSVRTALFRMKFIQRQVAELTTELDKKTEEHAAMKKSLFEAQGELVSLEEKRVLLEQEIEEMKLGLEQLREGRIVVMAKEILAQTGLEKDALSEDVPPALEALRQKGAFALSQRVLGREDPPDISLSPGTLEEVFQKLELQKGDRNVLRLVVEENAIYGEPVICRVEVIESEKIYEPLEELVRHTFPPLPDKSRAEQELYGMLQQVNRKAVKDGVLRDPLRGTVGNLEGTEFFDAVDLITTAVSPVTIIVRAAEEVYTEGPVKVLLEYSLQ